MKQEKYRPSALSGIAIRVIALTLALWLGAMGLLTWAVSRDFYHQLDKAAQNYVQLASRNAALDYPDLPGEMEATMIRQLGYPYLWIGVDEVLPIMNERSEKNDYSPRLYPRRWDLHYGYEAAVEYTDTASGITIGTGNYLYFPYVYDTDWLAQNLDPRGYAYVDLDALPEAQDIGITLFDTPTGSPFCSMELFRFMGYFEGNQFHPVKLERITNATVSSIPNAQQNVETYCRRDNRDLLEWATIFDRSGKETHELVTIYGWGSDAGGYKENRFRTAFTVKGVTFRQLSALLDAQLSTKEDFTQNNLFQSIIIHRATHEDRYGHFSITLALRCWPLEYAVLRLWKAYLYSFLLCAVLVVLILRRINRELIVPLQQANRLAAGYPEPPGTSYDPRWQESYWAERHIARLIQADHERKTEIQQLKTALDYAKNVEENRRQLVSNITHELKTPLAVIHSYAEGLQAGIAGENQDQYLAVIQSEAQKMDAMVLQMLDLSRLEAGRVRLKTENFSLLELAQSIAETMSPMAEGKELKIGWDYTEECRPTADLSRIRQVITNLLSNAIRYTPNGGEIRITVYEKEGEAHLYIENTSPPLHPEALERAFESFYQADDSRHSGGTGLGLAIVKQIVTLHRGSCTAENTPNGVRFGFHIPLS